MNNQKALKLRGVLQILISQNMIKGDINHGVSRNIIRLDKVNAAIEKDITAINDAYAEKDENGKNKMQPLMENGVQVKDNKGRPVNEIVWADKEAADKKRQDLMDETVDYSPYLIERSKDTDCIPAFAQMEMLDVIIVDNIQK